MIQHDTYSDTESICDWCGFHIEAHDRDGCPDKAHPTVKDVVAQMARENDESWYCNMIRGANLMRHIAYLKMTGEWVELPCVWCQYLGLGDNIPQAHVSPVASGPDYHNYLQDYGQRF